MDVGKYLSAVEKHAGGDDLDEDMNTSKRTEPTAARPGEDRTVRPRREPSRRAPPGEQPLVTLVGRLTLQNTRQLREQT
eukprot:13713587-Heterocapsa_arctica.AAC.1